MKNKKLKFTFWIIIIGIIIINIIAFNHAYKFTHFSSKQAKKVKPEDLSFKEKIKILFTGIDNPKPLNKNTPNQEFENVYLQSHEKIEGWLIKKEEHKGIVILYHGYSGSKSGNINYGEKFNEFGYSTFLIDFMGSGGSSGNQTTIGYKEARDVKESFEYIKSNYPNDKIILFGSSMGAVSIMKSIQDYDIKPDKIILECPFGSMRTTVQKRFEAMNVPSFILADLLLFYGGIQNNFNPYNHNPVEYAKSIDEDCLLLYGKNDVRVTQDEINSVFKNLKGSKNLKIFLESGHENYLVNNDKEWKNSILSFLKE